MKPNLAMTGTKCNFSDVSVIPSLEQVRQPGRPKWMTRLVASTVALVVVAGIVIGAVFLGSHLTKEAQKESWISFTGADGHDTHERLTVGENEVEAYIPGQYKVIFDYKRSVFLLKNLTDIHGICYMSTFDKAVFPSPTELRALMTDGESNEDAPTFVITLTSIKLSTDVLSEKSQEMCSTVYWALPYAGCGEANMRAKRRITLSMRINLGFVKFSIGNRENGS